MTRRDYITYRTTRQRSIPVSSTQLCAQRARIYLVPNRARRDPSLVRIPHVARVFGRQFRRRRRVRVLLSSRVTYFPEHSNTTRREASLSLSGVLALWNRGGLWQGFRAAAHCFHFRHTSRISEAHQKRLNRVGFPPKERIVFHTHKHTHRY